MQRRRQTTEQKQKKAEMAASPARREASLAGNYLIDHFDQNATKMVKKAGEMTETVSKDRARFAGTYKHLVERLQQLAILQSYVAKNDGKTPPALNGKPIRTKDITSAWASAKKTVEAFSKWQYDHIQTISSRIGKFNVNQIMPYKAYVDENGMSPVKLLAPVELVANVDGFLDSNRDGFQSYVRKLQQGFTAKHGPGKLYEKAMSSIAILACTLTKKKDEDKRTLQVNTGYDSLDSLMNKKISYLEGEKGTKRKKVTNFQSEGDKNAAVLEKLRLMGLSYSELVSIYRSLVRRIFGNDKVKEYNIMDAFDVNSLSLGDALDTIKAAESRNEGMFSYNLGHSLIRLYTTWDKHENGSTKKTLSDDFLTYLKMSKVGAGEVAREVEKKGIQQNSALSFFSKLKAGPLDVSDVSSAFLVAQSQIDLISSYYHDLYNASKRSAATTSKVVKRSMKAAENEAREIRTNSAAKASSDSSKRRSSRKNEERESDAESAREERRSTARKAASPAMRGGNESEGEGSQASGRKQKRQARQRQSGGQRSGNRQRRQREVESEEE